MKKFISLFVFILLIFTFNTTFNVHNVMALDNEVTQEEFQDNQQINNDTGDDVLDKPIFADEEQQKVKKHKFLNIPSTKVGHIINTILGAICLLIVALVCLFFIFLAHKQRKNEIRRKKMSANTNVINAVDNFARHRIK